MIIPGVVCLLLGSLQWYLIGRLWQKQWPNTYQARAVDRKKASATEKLPDPFLRPACETLRLNFDLELGPMGRPAKHLYGLSRVSRSLVVRPNLNAPDRGQFSLLTGGLAANTAFGLVVLSISGSKFDTYGQIGVIVLVGAALTILGRTLRPV